MRELQKRFPSLEQLLNLTADELAKLILEIMREREKDPISGDVNRESACREAMGLAEDVSPFRRRQLEEELDELFGAAFARLEEWKFIKPAVGTNGKNGYVVLTKQGAVSTAGVDLDEVRDRAQLNGSMLHPLLRGSVFTDFRAGRYGDAVFAAFKTVEMEVKKAARRPDSEFGSELIRAAFNEKNGPLTDMAENSTYREGLRMLFAGSLSRFKNPESHAKREFANVFEPMQELMLASRLLSIVDERCKT